MLRIKEKKSMKKIVLFLITLCMVVGCACTKDKASDAVKEYLNKYNNQHESFSRIRQYDQR